MWNIEFKGKVKGDLAKISSGEPMPEGAVQFKEPENSSKQFAAGTLLFAPFAAIMLGTALPMMYHLYGKPDKSSLGHHVIPMVICLAAMWVAMYVHEYIHALLFPKELKKEVYIAPEGGMFFVYCEQMVSKARFIVICMGPAVILGIIPFIVLMILMPQLPGYVTFASLIFTLGNTFSAVGDFYNTYNCIRQVPKGGKVFNRGIHSYWVN